MKAKYIPFEEFKMLYGKSTGSKEDDKRASAENDKGKRIDVERNKVDERVHIRNKS